MSETPYSCINSILYRFLQFSSTLILPNILLKTSLPEVAGTSYKTKVTLRDFFEQLH
jgi:hypothetical protein